MDTTKEKPAKKKPQIERFKEIACELGCEETEEAFEDSFSRVLPPKRETKGDGEDVKA